MYIILWHIVVSSAQISWDQTNSMAWAQYFDNSMYTLLCFYHTMTTDRCQTRPRSVHFKHFLPWTTVREVCTLRSLLSYLLYLEIALECLYSCLCGMYTNESVRRSHILEILDIYLMKIWPDIFSVYATKVIDCMVICQYGDQVHAIWTECCILVHLISKLGASTDNETRTRTSWNWNWLNKGHNDIIFEPSFGSLVCISHNIADSNCGVGRVSPLYVPMWLCKLYLPHSEINKQTTHPLSELSATHHSGYTVIIMHYLPFNSACKLHSLPE